MAPSKPPSGPHRKATTPRKTASTLLAQFLPGAKTEHKMDSIARRAKTPVNYAESEASSNPSPETPESQRMSELDQDELDQDEDDEEDTAIEYGRSTGRELRKRQPNRSIKAMENGNVPRKSSNNKRANRLALDELAGPDLPPILGSRSAIRQEIASKTGAYRNQFLIEKKDLWLPLLPKNNYVRKLIEKHDQLSAAEVGSVPPVSPYEEIETQPLGVKATMKPYQLSGLSFLVYLHRNGLSGILGDEMGLGKTLQTLSLIQYIKENEPKAGTGKLQRPCLVVCPLSVLSSWISEAKKWTPGLKVLRFHGPVRERIRLKKIAAGEIDIHGNMTDQAKAKFKARKGSSSRNAINLDTDLEDEEDVGVDLVVTTYECYRMENSWFKSAFVWRWAILDEGHAVKNHKSLVSKSLHGLKAEYRLILTGTPLQNNLTELWSLFHWLYPEVFTINTSELFETSFNLSKGQYSNVVLDDSRRLLELIMLRRMKNSPGVDLNLPPKTEVLLFVPLTPMQRFWYTRMITKADQGLLDELFKDSKTKEERDIVSQKEAEKREAELTQQKTEALQILKDPTLVGTDAWEETKTILAQTIQRENSKNDDGPRKSAWQKLMNLLMQLRKICNHPYQLSHAEPDPYMTGDHVITSSGKFIIMEKLIKELVVKQKKKILIFSGFTKMLDLVEELLFLRGGDGSSFRSVRIDGSTCRARRNLGIRMFNDLGSDYRVMLISTRAGGLGINLASASDVVLLDQDWNPQITLQAEARAHRIGQKNPVTVYKLVSQGTVEEQMMGRIQKKLYLSAKVTEAMEDIHTKFGSLPGKGKGKRSSNSTSDDNMPQLSTSQLMSLVRRGASAVSRPEINVSEMLSWDWETTVAKCKDQPADISVKKDIVQDAKLDEEEEKKWLTEMERVESSIFDGKKLAKRTASNKDIAQEFLDHSSRRVGKNTTVMVDGFAISKESMNCGEWEAVPTMAGKDPRLSEPKREKKAPIEHQSHCQVCLDGGDLHLCQLCPRSYHIECLDPEAQAKARSWQFNCPQHECHDCTQKTTDAGGMLYRCRWCERAYCEDCLDFDETTLVGNNLLEYELLDYPEVVQAFYIECPKCAEHFSESPGNKKLCDDLAEGWRLEHESVFGYAEIVNEQGRSTRAGSLTDATTVETPGVETPESEGDDDDESIEVEHPSDKKRKINAAGDDISPAKRVKMRV